MTKTRLLLLCASILGIGFVVLMPQISTGKMNSKQDLSMSKVQPELRFNTVTCLGKLEPLGEIIEVSASTSTKDVRLSKLFFREGERVERGQVIAKLSSSASKLASLNKAEAELKLAKAKLALEKAGAKRGSVMAQKAEIGKLEVERKTILQGQKATISRLKAELSNAQKDFERYQYLQKEGAVSQSDLDQKSLSYQRAMENLKEASALKEQYNLSYNKKIESAQANLDQITEVRDVDLAVKIAEVEKAKAALFEAKTSWDNTLVKSPVSGVIIEVLTMPGEKISERGIVEVANTERMCALAEVYQSDIGKIKINQSVQVKATSLPGLTLKGHVSRLGKKVLRQNVVNTDPASNTDARVVEVLIALDQDSSKKVSSLTNLQVNCQIMVAKSNDVIATTK